MKTQLNVVLYQPEIPYNTGAAIRLCAAFGAKLHLIRPYGFFLQNKEMKRAAVGYIEKIELIEHDTFEEFLKNISPARIYAFTKRGDVDIDKFCSKINYSSPIYLLFGRETNGLPEEILSAATSVRIPMAPGVRCMNLASAIACAMYEVKRNDGFAGLGRANAAKK